MNVHVHEHAYEQKTEYPIEINCLAGIALSSLAGIMFAAVIGGFLSIFADLTELRAHLGRLHSEGTLQVIEIVKAMQVMQMRLEAVSDRLQNATPPVEEGGPRPSGHKEQNLDVFLEAQRGLGDLAAHTPGPDRQ